MDPDFWIFLGVGFLAQLVDGALGMAYGIVSSTVLLAFGVPPAHASASVHAAEVFTTAASGGSHVLHRNVDWALFRRVALPGAIGGAIGAYLLTEIDGDTIRPFITAYLALIGCYILFRALRREQRHHHKPLRTAAVPLGLTGGFLDAVGGGGWGPVVTSTVLASGGAPRQTIGTVNAAEFFVTCAISAAFLVAILSGSWEDASDLTDHAWAVAGLVTGGLLAAPLAGWLVKVIPPKRLMVLVGSLVLAVAAIQTARAIGLM